MTAIKWVQWSSLKHHDGRRASAVGYNRSRWHLTTETTEATCRVACGAEINLHERYADSPPPGERCRKCWAALAARDRERETAANAKENDDGDPGRK